MKIADLELEIGGAPDDLEERIHALTGASVAEMRRFLGGPVIAGFIAKALQPFLTEAHDLAELAQKIAEHGVELVKAEVAQLYDEPASEAAAASLVGSVGSAEGMTDDQA